MYFNPIAMLVLVLIVAGLVVAVREKANRRRAAPGILPEGAPIPTGSRVLIGFAVAGGVAATVLAGLFYYVVMVMSHSRFGPLVRSIERPLPLLLLFWVGGTVVLFVRRRHLSSILLAWAPGLAIVVGMVVEESPYMNRREARARESEARAQYHNERSYALVRLVRAEAFYFEWHHAYSSDLQALEQASGGPLADDVTVTLTKAGTAGWTATAVHRLLPRGSCTVSWSDTLSVAAPPVYTEDYLVPVYDDPAARAEGSIRCTEE